MDDCTETSPTGRSFSGDASPGLGASGSPRPMNRKNLPLSVFMHSNRQALGGLESSSASPSNRISLGSSSISSLSAYKARKREARLQKLKRRASPLRLDEATPPSGSDGCSAVDLTPRRNSPIMNRPSPPVYFPMPRIESPLILSPFVLSGTSSPGTNPRHGRPSLLGARSRRSAGRGPEPPSLRRYKRPRDIRTALQFDMLSLLDSLLAAGEVDVNDSVDLLPTWKASLFQGAAPARAHLLLLAVRLCSVDFVRCLVSRGAIISAADAVGRTCLDYLLDRVRCSEAVGQINPIPSTTSSPLGTPILLAAPSSPPPCIWTEWLTTATVKTLATLVCSYGAPQADKQDVPYLSHAVLLYREKMDSNWDSALALVDVLTCEQAFHKFRLVWSWVQDARESPPRTPLPFMSSVRRRRSSACRTAPSKRTSGVYTVHEADLVRSDLAPRLTEFLKYLRSQRSHAAFTTMWKLVGGPRTKSLLQAS
ncbi:MAG: hypothetical protein KVP17_000412 [Porospora cf. gigantea B]|nr:MAG: hypothetical protein KVP17_000412 [Porospora cf. gigantea B]